MKIKGLGLKGLVIVGSLLGLGCETTQSAPRSAESYRREAQAWDTFGYANRSLSTNPNIPWDTRNLLENSANNQDYFRDMYDRKAADRDREEIIGAIRDSAQVKSYGVESNNPVNNNGDTHSNAKSQGSAKGEINYVRIDRDVYMNDEKGINFHVGFDIEHNKGWPTEVVVRFHDFIGRKLMDKDENYRLLNGQVGISKIVYPAYENTEYKDLQFFIPYNQLDITESGKHNLQIEVHLIDKSTGELRKIDEYEPGNQSRISFKYIVE